jgi:hypothetical protein
MTEHQVSILLVSIIAILFLCGTICLILDSFLKKNEPEITYYKKSKSPYYQDSISSYDYDYLENNSVIIDDQNSQNEEEDSTISGINEPSNTLDGFMLNFDDDDFNPLTK